MKRFLLILLLVVLPLSVGAQKASPARPATVSFASGNASALEMIKAITQQTCAPIGIVPGHNPGELSSERRAFDLKDVPVKDALEQVVADLGYSVEQKDGVFLLTAYDATAQQLDLLNHRFAKFGGTVGGTMKSAPLQDYQAILSAWMGAVTEPRGGRGGIGSVLSGGEEMLSMPEMHNSSAEEIADRIVTLGSKGMWMARIPADERLRFGNVGIEFTSYQHYACGSQPAKH